MQDMGLSSVDNDRSPAAAAASEGTLGSRADLAALLLAAIFAILIPKQKLMISDLVTN